MTDHGTSANYYYLANGLGSITEIQDSSGNTVEQYSYDSFGNPTILAGTELTESRYCTGITLPLDSINTTVLVIP